MRNRTRQPARNAPAPELMLRGGAQDFVLRRITFSMRRKAHQDAEVAEEVRMPMRRSRNRGGPLGPPGLCAQRIYREIEATAAGPSQCRNQRG
jgi:hypothetical protein